MTWFNTYTHTHTHIHPHIHIHTHSSLTHAAAGHYVPATARVIVESNSIYAKNLKGIGIGNGWVDPYAQYGAYAQVMVMCPVYPLACHVQSWDCCREKG